MEKQTIRTSLGLGWVFIRDIIYFAVFIMFRYLMSGGALVDGMNFIVYLMTGIVPWFFMNEVINGGANAIRTNAAIINSIIFPITIIPTIEVLAIFLKRLFTFLIVYVVCAVSGYALYFSPLIFIYYFTSMFILMILFNLIVTALVAISEDFNQLYMAVARVIFFSMPIIWSFENVQGYTWAIRIIKLNPMTYVIMGFRDAFVLGKTPNIEYTVYFWIICIVMFLIGCYTQYRLRRYYSDFM